MTGRWRATVIYTAAAAVLATTAAAVAPHTNPDRPTAGLWIAAGACTVLAAISGAAARRGGRL